MGLSEEWDFLFIIGHNYYWEAINHYIRYLGGNLWTRLKYFLNLSSWMRRMVRKEKINCCFTEGTCFGCKILDKAPFITINLPATAQEYVVEDNIIRHICDTIGHEYVHKELRFIMDLYKGSGEEKVVCDIMASLENYK